MMELGELEAQHAEFAKRDTRVYAISLEDQDAAKASQADYPHLILVSDRERTMSEALQVVHARSAPDGGDTSAPTTFLLDGSGTVRWAFRPDRVITRLAPAQVLEAVDQKLPANPQ